MPLATLGSVLNQVRSTLIVIIWGFIGIEGASIYSARARKREDVGCSTVMGVLFSAVYPLERSGDLLTVRAYLGRSIVSPVCFLTLSSKALGKVKRSPWLLVTDANTGQHYCSNLSSVAFGKRRIPGYRAQAVQCAPRP